MVAPRLRTRKKKRVAVRVPGGSTVIRYLARKKGKLKCRCGRDILGTSPENTRLPSRKLGMLCSVCCRESLVQQARSIVLNSEENPEEQENV